MKQLWILLLTLTLLLSGCGREEKAGVEKEPEYTDDTVEAVIPDKSGVVYVPLWMEEGSVAYYDADLNRTIGAGRDLTAEEIAGRDDIDPGMMYGSILAEPNTKVTYGPHGFLQNIYYLADDGVSYQLAPPEARK